MSRLVDKVAWKINLLETLDYTQRHFWNTRQIMWNRTKIKNQQTHIHSQCDSHSHVEENVSLFVKQRSLTESISRQGEWRILDSIKLTAFLVGTPLTGPLFNQTACLKETNVCVFVLWSVCACLSYEWTLWSPSPLCHLALLRDLDLHKYSQNRMPPSAVSNAPQCPWLNSSSTVNAGDFLGKISIGRKTAFWHCVQRSPIKRDVSVRLGFSQIYSVQGCFSGSARRQLQNLELFNPEKKHTHTPKKVTFQNQ